MSLCDLPSCFESQSPLCEELLCDKEGQLEGTCGGPTLFLCEMEDGRHVVFPAPMTQWVSFGKVRCYPWTRVRVRTSL